mmetsp:Transcript_10146/g.26267  ORF Transcript_10146/g.26267 Transcript_10146/m.26267 type:complete len:524 (-) Transcript_10146:275-1846(-)
MAEGKTLEITCERAEGEPRGGFGIAVEQRKGFAWVSYTVDPAKAAGLIQKGDKITHIEGKGPLGHAEVCKALKACAERARITVVRGLPLPSAGRRTVSVLSFCSIAVLMCAMSWTALDMPGPDALLAEMDRRLGLDSSGRPSGGEYLADEGLREGVSAKHHQEPREQKQHKPAIQVGGKVFHLLADGSTDDVLGLRTAMRSDKAFMSDLRANSPDWAGVIAGGADGSFDETAFQERLRRNFQEYSKSVATKLNEDGSAVNPSAYLDVARKDKKWMKMLNAIPEAELREEILRGNPEALQQLLKSSKQQADGVVPPPPPPMPPNPATPYDDIGQVGMSMRILTDEGEEKDLYSLQPKENHDETGRDKMVLPPHLRCAACQASAHQGALAVSDALRRRYKDDLVGLTALEAMEGLCDNAPKWTSDYGLQPTKTGVNTITGPGVTTRQDDLFDGQEDVMLQTQHSQEIGRKLADACREMLLGAELDEAELAATAMKAEESGDEESVSRTFIHLLCEQEGQPCAVAA